MSELEFSFQETLNELQALSGLAERFLEPSSRHVLSDLSENLENIRTSGGRQVWQWGINANSPLLTIVSEGLYQRSRKGAHKVFAEITCVWSIKRIEPPKKSMLAQRFALAGIASTKVRLAEQGEDGKEELGMWRMEVGDAASPGCHFHVQIGGESDRLPFPHSLDIPRLPGIISTPPLVIEFVLGELFQDEWVKHCGGKTAVMNRWAPIQKRRLTALLAWQQSVVASSSGSPWITLKLAKPAVGMFE